VDVPKGPEKPGPFIYLRPSPMSARARWGHFWGHREREGDEVPPRALGAVVKPWVGSPRDERARKKWARGRRRCSFSSADAPQPGDLGNLKLSNFPCYERAARLSEGQSPWSAKALPGSGARSRPDCKRRTP